jgi:hypothetical protein
MESFGGCLSRQVRLLCYYSKHVPILSILFILSNLFSRRDLAASKDIQENLVGNARFLFIVGCGEWLCAMLILNVWDPGGAKLKEEWRFEFFDFAGIADSGNRRALLNWLANPEWP